MIRKDSGKNSAEDISRIKREKQAGNGIPAAMTHMVIMILPPSRIGRPGPGNGSRTVMSEADTI